MSTKAGAWPPRSGQYSGRATARGVTTESGRRRHRIRVLVLAADPQAAAEIQRRLHGLSVIEMVGTVRSPDAAVAQCARTRVNVLVAVVEAQTMPARELHRVAAIRAKFPSTRVVLALGRHDRVWQSLLVRPDGLLAAEAPTPELDAVVGTAAAGHVTIGRSLREAFFHACAPADEADETPLEELTPRELQIISGGARGLTSRAIAKELHLAVNTVDKALTVIYRKLRAKNRTEACLIAARRGLLR